MDARKHPEAHRDLVVRIAGYSAYFVQLNDSMQQEVIQGIQSLECRDSGSRVRCVRTFIPVSPQT